MTTVPRFRVRISAHARKRCAEMGISTKVAKHIVYRPDSTWPGNPGTECYVAVADQHPEYAVVYRPTGDDALVVTVVFRTRLRYKRAGASFRVVSS